ncbi:protein-L-isoaspartate(D-aspartate) O-methyltransferase [Coraliomargarita parva]|uniref:protein-L-isoaspartate(D-aspartate) O-methyltransferase n=1 Tax=Coraliomargarita parva TaxID=3014050 RepID=UPI0022B52F5D|nr:protein-L-isoaspartate(D-aspartate) O-methyltransferase [Coraliomargarita parva]
MAPYPEAVKLARGIRDPRVREAFCRVDRSRFVPATLQSAAWEDHPLPIGDNATISQPSLVAEMSAWLSTTPSARVLEIGTGSGYQTAILAGLCAEIYTMELNPDLARTARARLEALGFQNIHYKAGDGAKGWPEAAPFDRIIATVAFPGKPQALLDQLEDSGIALVPVGPDGGTQSLMRYRQVQQSYRSEAIIPVRFLSLR